MRFPWKLIICSAAVCAGAFLMVGCSTSSIANSSTSGPVKTPAVPSAVPFKGIVHGGQNAVKNAEVYLLAVSGSGYGHQSTSLITSSSNPTGLNGWDYVLTDDQGSFNIPSGTYGCTTGQQVYLYAQGGDAFDQNGTILSQNLNSAIGLMAVLGTCGSGNSISPALPNSIQLNEVTTVAAAYSLAGFATDAADISSSGSSLAITGLNNAVLNARGLVDLSTGLVTQTPPTGVVLPSAMVYTIADILAACINSQNSSTAACTKLMTDETYNSGVPGDTAGAAINMAHQPGVNVADLYGNLLSSPPFMGFIPTPGPNDFAVGITYTGGGLTAPTAIAIDAGGNGWMTDTPTGVTGAVIGLDPQGNALPNTPLTCGSTLIAPSAIAVGSGSSMVWVASSSAASVNGVPFGGGACSTPEPSGPATFCTDTNNNPTWCTPTGLAVNSSLYVVDNGSQAVDSFDSSGNPGTFWQGSFTNPDSVTIDGSGNVWVADENAIFVTPNIYEIAGGTVSVTYPGAPFGFATNALAIGTGGNLWAADLGSDSAYLFTNTGSFLDNSFADPAGGISLPGAIAVDGAGNVWIANAGGTTGGASDIAELAADGSAALSPTGTPPTPPGGYTGNVITNADSPTGVGIDPSGNVWVSIKAGVSSSTGPVVEFIGLAAPTVTPLADAAVSNKIATLP